MTIGTAPQLTGTSLNGHQARRHILEQTRIPRRSLCLQERQRRRCIHPRPPPLASGRYLLAALGLLAVVAAAVGWLFLSRKAHALTEKDTIVLADFTNTTGDAVFDGTLRQGLAVQLEQSPFLSLISDERIRQTLRLMDQPVGAKLTPEIGREICQRTTSAAVLSGSIANLGNQYVLGLEVRELPHGRFIGGGTRDRRR